MVLYKVRPSVGDKGHIDIFSYICPMGMNEAELIDCATEKCKVELVHGSPVNRFLCKGRVLIY